MIQAFHTASSGMQAQQKAMDVISNNIANINTPGYRIKRAEFQELLYTKIKNQQTEQNLLTGHGVKVSNISTMPLADNVNPLNFGINGNGYFVVEDANGNRSYTKKGEFKLINENGNYFLGTQDNKYVLGVDGNKMEMSNKLDQLIVNDGILYIEGNNGERGITPGIVQFENPRALSAVDREYFLESAQSGTPIKTNERIFVNYYDELEPTAVLDQMNEMTRMVQTQRAYQMNSKVLQVIDEMEGMANHLRY